MVERATTEMILPEVPKGWIIFDLGNKPGYVIVGPRSRFELEDENGYAPYEISWEKAVQMLNDKNDPANLHYHDEPATEAASLDEESYEVDYEDDEDDDMPKRGARFNKGYAKKKNREKNRDEQRRVARLIKERIVLGEDK